MSIKLPTKMLVDYLTSMNKYYLDGVLVVEGKDDVSYLSSFIKTLYLTTNGYDISKEKIDFLSRVAKVNIVYLLTDNDEAGEKIASTVKSEIKEIFEIKTAKMFKNSAKKRGVAETDKTAIIEAFGNKLENYKGQSEKVDYDLVSIISLSKEPEIIKQRIIDDYRLINGNLKFLENQLQMLKISKEEIKQKYGN